MLRPVSHSLKLRSFPRSHVKLLISYTPRPYSSSSPPSRQQPTTVSFQNNWSGFANSTRPGGLRAFSTSTTMVRRDCKARSYHVRVHLQEAHVLIAAQYRLLKLERKAMPLERSRYVINCPSKTYAILTLSRYLPTDTGERKRNGKTHKGDEVVGDVALRWRLTRSIVLSRTSRSTNPRIACPRPLSKLLAS